jgi:hypothetical protein
VWFSIPITALDTKTIAAISLYIRYIPGLAANTRSTCEIYSDVNGYPGVAISSAIALDGQAGGTWWRWAGFSQAKTLGTKYHFVIKNTAADATTNWFQAGGCKNVSEPVWGGGDVRDGSVLLMSTNSGSTWGTYVTPSWSGWVAENSDGTAWGLPFFEPAQETTKLYGTASAGWQFVSPANVGMRISGVWLDYGKSGTPGDSLIRIRFNGTNYDSIPKGSAYCNNNIGVWRFASAVVIPASATVQILLVATGDASNYFVIRNMRMSNIAAHISIVPYQWKYVSTTDGTTMVTDQTKIPGGGLVYDNEYEVPAPVFPAGNKTNPDQGTFGPTGTEITASQDLPDLETGVVTTDTLEGEAGGVDIAALIAAAQAANNSAPSNGNNSLLPGETVKVAETIYTGPAAGSNVLFLGEESSRNDFLFASDLVLGTIRKNRGVDVTGDVIEEVHKPHEVLTTADLLPGNVVNPAEEIVKEGEFYGVDGAQVGEFVGGGILPIISPTQHGH